MARPVMPPPRERRIDGMSVNGAEPRQQNIVLTVLVDAITTIVVTIISTAVIIFIGKHFRGFGLLLAGIEVLLAAFQSLKIIIALVCDIVITFAVWFGKREREKNETQMLWGTLIRIVELGIWVACLFVLYKFFYG
jgi:magnesium-transporting ATPase (P-type)